MSIYFHNYYGCSRASANALRGFLGQFGATELEETDNIPKDPMSIIFIHGMPESEKEAIARNYTWLHVIGVSSVPATISPPDGTLHNLHKCRHSTSRLADADSPVRDFLQAYLEGRPFVWSKIEPLKQTDHLVALYLLELANQDTSEIGAMKKLECREAKKEYFEITGKTLQLPDGAAQRLAALRTILTSLTTE